MMRDRKVDRLPNGQVEAVMCHLHYENSNGMS